MKKLPSTNRTKYASQTEQIEDIKKHMNKLEETGIGPLIILIHSFDMGHLKQAESVDILAEMAACKGIRLIVTLDSCKASVLFSDHLLD